MAKRQNFIVGSTNDNTATLTPTELNNAWNHNALLESSVLDGTFNAVSDYSNDSSNEIANAIQSITGSEPTGATQTELASALQQMRDEITTSSLRFIGYVATSAPSASNYALIEGNLWINASAMPTTFPVAASLIKQWNGSSWVNYGSTYTPSNFECWRNVNDTNGYYWFGGQWTVMSTDMSVDYFTLNAAGKWEIKSSVNLPGSPTTTTPTAGNSSTRIATTKFVADSFAPLASPALTGTPTAPTVASITDNSTKLATTKFVLDALKAIYPVDSIYIGTGATCPLASLFGTWTRIDAGLALWTGNGTKGSGSTVNTTSTGATNKINAGLPNITGQLDVDSNGGATNAPNNAFSNNPNPQVTNGYGGNVWHLKRVDFKASDSNSIYRDGVTTVQPPAYVVNVWRRTA